MPTHNLPTRPPVARLRDLVLQRAALTVIGAVAIAAVAPAIANAAGANVPNPVVIALRNSGGALAETLTGDDECTPDDVVVSDEPGSTAGSDVTAAEGAAPVADDAACSDDDTAVVVDASPAPEADESELPDDDSDGDGDDADGNHGQIVSTVAKCAPRGKDPLFELTGDDLANHGAFVRVAAHGDTLTTPFGDFDLSTQAGADDLCAALEAARAAQESGDDADAKEKKDKKDKKDKKEKKAKKGAAQQGS